MSTAKRQGWNEPSDDIDVAYKLLKDALHEAHVYAERYERAINGTKAENEAQNINLARRSGWARLALGIIRNIHVDLQ